MLFGHNTNLKSGNITYHVQTEDRGAAHAMIDTTVYYHGRVLHRRATNYFDLLPLNEEREQSLRSRLDEQHKTVINEIRSGALLLAVPPFVEASQPAEPQTPAAANQPVASEPRKLLLELVNAKSWLSGKKASLQVAVREHSGAPIPGAKVSVEIEGSESANAHTGQTGLQGEARIEFELPRITSPEGAMVITVEDQGASGRLRFALRAKPRVSSL